jgi:hypothetical protein
MKSNILLPGIAIGFLMIMGSFVLINPSYEKSITAKYYYEMGNYDEAYILAKESFSLDVYNRMASTVMAQSQTALKYVNYINLAKKYMIQIDKIALHDTISDADKAKIRIICEIMMSSYIKLAPSIITDNNLVTQTANYYQNFEKLSEKVTKK